MKRTYSLSEIDAVAREILGQCTNKTILFYGDMGVGKTTLIKSLVKELGYSQSVSSPTFSIVNEYLTDKEETIFHFDFYRLKDTDEVYDIGIEDYLDSDAWIFIEWPEKINIFLSGKEHSANISSINDRERLIKFS